MDQEISSQVVGLDYTRAYGLHAEIGSDNGISTTPSPAAAGVHMDSVEEDPLIDSYYKNFHKFHPLLLPKKHLARLYRVPSRQLTLKPLIAIVRFIGNIYSSRVWSVPLKHYAETCFSQAQAADPIMVQCRLLSSVAHFWFDHRTNAVEEMNTAIRLAVILDEVSQVELEAVIFLFRNLQQSMEPEMLYSWNAGGGLGGCCPSWIRTM
jgi:hypothetical protein